MLQTLVMFPSTNAERSGSWGTIMRNPTLALLLATTASAAIAAPAFAADPDQAAPEKTTSVGEILVTADKRPEALKDVPMAVSAVTSQRVELIQANSLADYISQVPGVTF